MGSHTNAQAAVMDSLRTLVRALRVSTQAVERARGISGAQLFVLQQLSHAPARSVNELAERTRTHQSSVSTVVSRLVARGLAVRAPSEDDARRMEVRITPAGLGILGDSPPTLQARMVDALATLPAGQVQALADGLAALVREVGIQELPASFFYEDEGGEDG
jgi:DNA-binding MarR family transcriptional regulator